MMERKPWREYPLMAVCVAIIAVAIVYIHDRYTSPDRIEEKPLLEFEYTDVKENEMISGTRLDEFFQRELLFELQPVHGAPESDLYMTKLNTLCYTFRSVCDRVRLIGKNFSPREQYFYRAIPIYLVYYFDRYGSFDHHLENILHTVTVSGDTGRRGYANHDSVIINTSDIGSIREYLEILTHELGHVVDLGAITGTMKRRDTTFTEFGHAVFALDDPSLDYYKLSRSDESTRKTGQTRDDFCSGYGQRNPFEDFSECMNLYINHHDLFTHITSRSRTLERKYAYLKDLYDGFYLYRDARSVRKYADPSDYYIFDTSKIAG